MQSMDDLLNTDMLDPIESNIVEQILSAKPFYKVEGGFNFRDISDPSYTALKPGYAFRSGSLEKLTAKGQQDLVQLGLKTVFDLRSTEEVDGYPDPTIEGVEVVLAPTDQTWTKRAIEDGVKDIATMYLYMVRSSATCFRTVLTHVRDSPERPFLLHCNAGKDRTGVVAALILALAGLPPDYIAREYALTRIGVEPVREFLTLKLTGGKVIDLRTMPILQILGSSRLDSMASMLEKIDQEYGGVERYIMQELEFSKEDIDKMRANLRGT